MNTSLPIKDIHLPDPVGVWPPAIGWWLLVLIGIVLFIAALKGWRSYQQKWRYRRSALRQLNTEFKQWQQQSNTDTTLYAMLALLKRTAITAYPQAAVGSLSGEQWLLFLDSHTTKPCFTPELQQTISQSLYQPQVEADIPKLYLACQQWIKQHYRSYQPVMAKELGDDNNA